MQKTVSVVESTLSESVDSVEGSIERVEFALCENGDVGSTVLNSLVDTDSNLLVMGGYGSSRVREHVFGGVTRTILESMTTPVCMLN
ncbi:MAG: hypothetical protein A6F72_06895 [Cycloclasticus sp. symbiont of Poecilosclerida sp. N]|nr:MAG: hypothetical protein A6F72_06895 [Cycloclasticus sp. symbiont of Poecilosclerida sp. N]